ncbi:hypothetical protein F4141_21270 [Candidatus Poribacteria bacterium]|nr:hypothetical protein [Candidatus Poribacteria bacterium]MYH83221.1 hypothetical protein [Candidatus Poribacteria bacterium]
MKMSLSQIIAIACILTIGGLGLLPLMDTADAHPKREDWRHTVYTCYVVHRDTEPPYLVHICMSYTDSGKRAVWPWAGHKEEANQPGPHKPHTVEENTHSYDYDNYERDSCSKC